MTASQQVVKTRGDTLFAVTNRLGAYGSGLLSLYLELQTLPGDRAKTGVEIINKWRAALTE
jgi:hypothetical protein